MRAKLAVQLKRARVKQCVTGGEVTIARLTDPAPPLQIHRNDYPIDIA